jgi:hypothetical protein
MNGAAAFPGDDLFPEFFPQLPRSSDRLVGPRRFSPSLLKIGRFTRTKQISCLKPAQERSEIREQLGKFTVLERARIEEIKRQMVSKEKECIFPV